MSIEAMYPSRRQGHSQNPLFARELRRQRFGLMLILAALGLGLLLLQLLPITAHADNTTMPAPAAATIERVKAETPAAKLVRQIQIYQMQGISY